MIKHRLKLNYECSVVENCQQYFNEIKTIFFTYNYTKKSNKLKKHFPLVYNISYNRIISKYKPYIRPVSCSLLLNEIKEQLIEFINTAERRLNWMQFLGSDIELLLFYNKLGIQSPIPSMYSHQIVKYNKEKIAIHFPELKDTMFDVIYKIYNENFHLYADISSSNLCNFILVCCIHLTKTYHVFFYFDKKHINYPIELYKNKDYIKDIFLNPIKKL